MMFKKLTPAEVDDFEQWAEGDFDANEMPMPNSVHHPVCRAQFLRLAILHYQTKLKIVETEVEQTQNQ